jgi:hypothetical protein
MIISVTKTPSLTILTHDSFVLARKDGRSDSRSILCNFGKSLLFANNLSWMAIEIAWGLTPLDDHWVVEDTWTGI